VNFESEKSIDQVLADDLESLSFDDWKQLHEKDPEQFNYYRKLMLEQQITLAPEKMQPRLRGLMFQLEGEAVRSRTAMAYNRRLSEMMVELVEQLRDKLLLLSEAQRVVKESEKTISPSAEIIPFRPSQKYQQY